MICSMRRPRGHAADLVAAPLGEPQLSVGAQNDPFRHAVGSGNRASRHNAVRADPADLVPGVIGLSASTRARDGPKEPASLPPGKRPRSLPQPLHRPPFRGCEPIGVRARSKVEGRGADDAVGGSPDEMRSSARCSERVLRRVENLGPLRPEADGFTAIGARAVGMSRRRLRMRATAHSPRTECRSVPRSARRRWERRGRKRNPPRPPRPQGAE